MTDNNSHTANSSSFPPSDWVETTLGEIATFSQGFQVPTDYQYTEPKEWFVRFVRIVDYINEEEKPRYIKNPGRCFVNEDDLVMIRYGSQTAGKIVRGIAGVIANNTFQIKPIENIDKNWLFWFLRQDSIYQFLNKDQSSSTMPAITFTQVEKLKISLPPLPEQKAIASVLSAFDDKIELLREQNKTLEDIGQTIFQEWFGKYGVDDELPEGWRVGKLGEEFDITIGRTPPRAESQWFSDTPTGKKWISIKDIGNSGTYIFNTSEFLTDDAIEKFNIPIIPKNTTILSFKMTVGKLTITTEEMLSNEAIAHLKLKNDSVLSSEFIYLYLQNLDFNALGSTSSIVTAINSTMIKNLEVIIPDQKTLKQFDETIQPMFAKIRYNSEQIQSLARIRDTLLPKLMSGELRVRF